MSTKFYFRCDRLLATLSVALCHSNREESHARRAGGGLEGQSNVQWMACRECPLAAQVDAGQVPLLTAEEVRRGLGLQLARSVG